MRNDLLKQKSDEITQLKEEMHQSYAQTLEQVLRQVQKTYRSALCEVQQDHAKVLHKMQTDTSKEIAGLKQALEEQRKSLHDNTVVREDIPNEQTQVLCLAAKYHKEEFRSSGPTGCVSGNNTASHAPRSSRTLGKSFIGKILPTQLFCRCPQGMATPLLWQNGGNQDRAVIRQAPTPLSVKGKTKKVNKNRSLSGAIIRGRNGYTSLA